MLSPKLRVQQGKSATTHPADEMHETHLRGVRAAEIGPAEHRLTEEGAAHVYAIQPADELIAEPRFEAMSRTVLV